jgi:uncharacterized protein YraI
MQFRSTIFAATMTAAAALSVPAYAATFVTATTPLNIRSGPGPQYGLVGSIPIRAQAAIIGCVQGSLWCQVSYNGQQGWAYSQYLMAQLSGRDLVVAENLSAVPPVVYQAPAVTVGSAMPATPAITGTLAAPPVAAAPLALVPPEPVNSYVAGHPVAPVYLNGEVVEGVGLPEDVAIAPVPGTDYDYAYVNSVPVLVEPSTLRVTYVYR